MTADEAGESWLTRTNEIVSESVDPNYASLRVFDEANVAIRGIDALIANRNRELTPGMVEQLRDAQTALHQFADHDPVPEHEQTWWEKVKTPVQDGIARTYDAVKEEAGKLKAETDKTVILLVIAGVVALGILYFLDKKAVGL